MTTQANNSHERNRFAVVVGVDFSEASAQALSAAAELAARSAGGELHLVHVVAAVIPPATGGFPYLPRRAAGCRVRFVS